MEIDHSEPPEALPILSPVIPEAVVSDLNNRGYADYLWNGVEGQQQAERKTWFDLTDSVEHIEDQLRRQKQAHPDVRLMLIVEGIAVPSMGGTSVFSESTKGKRQLFYSRRTFSKPIKVAYAWLYQTAKYMEVYYTPNYQATLTLLTTFYKADQKADHATFHRHIKEMNWSPNPMVVKLMGVGGHLGIGEARATDLIKRFGTVYHVITASPEELATVPGIGKTIAVQFLRGVGRLDV